MAFTHIPLRRSIVGGALAYLIGYVFTFVIVAGHIGVFLSETVVDTLGTEPKSLATLLGSSPPTTVPVGWLFHNSFQTPTQIPVSSPLASRAVPVARDLIAATSGPFLVLYLVPPLILIATGYFAAQGRTPGVRGELYTGGATTFGFLPLALLGAFVFTVNIDGTTIVAAPDALLSIITGIVYPTVFGGFGGSLAG